MNNFKLILLLITALTCPAVLAQQPDRRKPAPAPAGLNAGGVEAFTDQSFVAPQNLGANINEGYAFVAQTYTAGVTGRLLAVSIDVRSKRGLNPETEFDRYPLRVAVCEVLNKLPGAVLGEVTLAADEAPLSTLIKFPQKIRQVKGRRYAIAVNYENAPASGAGRWLGVWAGGSGSIRGEMLAGPDGKTWFASGDDDHALRFRTYVLPRGRRSRTARR
jgi:hypothetical protein